jgi:hypothetical protein
MAAGVKVPMGGGDDGSGQYQPSSSSAIYAQKLVKFGERTHFAEVALLFPEHTRAESTTHASLRLDHEL